MAKQYYKVKIGKRWTWGYKVGEAEGHDGIYFVLRETNIEGDWGFGSKIKTIIAKPYELLPAVMDKHYGELRLKSENE
jgi:hypothetical protein